MRLARAAGLAARRSWDTAQHPDSKTRACDVLIDSKPYQVKRSRDGFQTLYDGLRDVAGLFVRSDARKWLAVLPA